MADRGDPPARQRAEVIYIGGSEHFTVEQALAAALQEHRHICELTDVLIIGRDANDKFTLSSSHMSREWALWLIKEAEDYIRRVGRHTPD